MAYTVTAAKSGVQLYDYRLLILHGMTPKWNKLKNRPKSRRMTTDKGRKIKTTRNRGV